MIDFWREDKKEWNTQFHLQSSEFSHWLIKWASIKFSWRSIKNYLNCQENWLKNLEDFSQFWPLSSTYNWFLLLTELMLTKLTINTLMKLPQSAFYSMNLKYLTQVLSNLFCFWLLIHAWNLVVWQTKTMIFCCQILHLIAQKFWKRTNNVWSCWAVAIYSQTLK